MHTPTVIVTFLFSSREDGDPSEGPGRQSVRDLFNNLFEIYSTICARFIRQSVRDLFNNLFDNYIETAFDNGFDSYIETAFDNLFESYIQAAFDSYCRGKRRGKRPFENLALTVL